MVAPILVKWKSPRIRSMGFRLCENWLMVIVVMPKPYWGADHDARTHRVGGNHRNRRRNHGNRRRRDINWIRSNHRTGRGRDSTHADSDRPNPDADTDANLGLAGGRDSQHDPRRGQTDHRQGNEAEHVLPPD